MPVIRIPEPIFARLQKIATPLVDSPASVVEKLLDFYESRRGKGAAPHKTLERETRDAPDLHHTHRLAAEFDGHPATNWNDLVAVAHRRALSEFNTFERLRSISPSNLFNGKKLESGFFHVPRTNISIQRVDANTAWRNALHLAQVLKVPIKVTFEWQNKKGAASPGQTGVLEWSP